MGLPLDSTCPDSDWAAGKTSPRAVAFGAGDRQPSAFRVRQGQDGEVGTRQFLHLASDARQHLSRVRAGKQRGGDVRACLDQPPAAAGGVVQPRVVHCDTRRGAKRDEHRLVVFGELAGASLFRQVQIAEYLVPHPHRDTEEAAHRRMPRGETRGRLVRADVRQAKWPRIVDQQAEQAAPLRPVMDLPDLFSAQPDRDELG